MQPEPVVKVQPHEKIAFITVDIIIRECENAIKEYNLSELVKKAKHGRDGFKKLAKEEKELLCTGLIKLGEALTFCRNRQTLGETGIANTAVAYANARNHFVHYQLYHNHLHEGSYNKAQEWIDKLYTIEVLKEKLNNLRKCGLEELSKPIEPIEQGKNNFDFKYDHYVKCLREEFEELKRILAMPDIASRINSDVAQKAELENRIRNILAIMIDLTDEDGINKNKNNNPCTEQKNATKLINETFCREYPEFRKFFRDLKITRNSLCHLDESLKKPYSDTQSMIEFAAKLRRMEELGYVARLGEQILREQEEKKDRYPQLPVRETMKKPKAGAKELTGLEFLAASYASSDDEEKEKEKPTEHPLPSGSAQPKQPTEPPKPSSPRMGGTS